MEGKEGREGGRERFHKPPNLIDNKDIVSIGLILTFLRSIRLKIPSCVHPYKYMHIQPAYHLAKLIKFKLTPPMQ